VGYDLECLQTEDWMATMGVDDLEGGRSQPFYHVCVDGRDRPGQQVTYVAQENIERDHQALIAVEPVQHPLVTAGTHLRPETFDADRGAYLPTPQLRTLYPPQVQGCWMVDQLVESAVHPV
jgi:F-box protein 21